jgi:hypothetical protein
MVRPRIWQVGEDIPSDALPVEHHNVIYARGTPCETLSPGEQPCAHCFGVAGDAVS